MKRDFEGEFEQAFVGRACSIERELPFWRANFGDGYTMAFRVPWRIVTNGRVAFGNEDEGQLFGLPAPVNGVERSAKLLHGKFVIAVQLDRQTGDLRIVFDGDTRLDVFNHSLGYEGWYAYYSAHGERWGMIAMGGGEIAVVPDE
ncbi:DUF6188 family protein [Sphingomonas sp. PL-96]|uniref:DUF6188 family protein n=1 Tax=Sphingomonas sp. PL-96 TaxID=2887201 RepID=UPI001E3A052B|nr:DUF6188 family protein [Sphingomonas sp. PL-96]MCC2977945.1 DUF6188 family protein [Sphingomonas sp. PL-96]